MQRGLFRCLANLLTNNLSVSNNGRLSDELSAFVPPESELQKTRHVKAETSAEVSAFVRSECQWLLSNSLSIWLLAILLIFVVEILSVLHHAADAMTLQAISHSVRTCEMSDSNAVSRRRHCYDTHAGVDGIDSRRTHRAIGGILRD